MDAQAYYEEIDYQVNAPSDYLYEAYGAEARLLRETDPDYEDFEGEFPAPEPQYPSCPVDLGYDIDEIPF